jgi:imidazolonepropionase
MSTLFGPFRQILTMAGLPDRGALKDDALDVRTDAGVWVEAGEIKDIGPFQDLRPKAKAVVEIEGDQVLVPGLIDSHTHICYAGDRFADYAMKLSGATYEDILREGGGIRRTVRETRKAADETLRPLTARRVDSLRRAGVTTFESKSGYGLDVETELRQLRIIRDLGGVPTCLAAHVMPDGYEDMAGYLKMLRLELFPRLKAEGIRRVDLFWDAVAFHGDAAISYLEAARLGGFDVTVHADQFSRGGTRAAVRVGAVSADHLEVISMDDIEILARSRTAATALPGACIGLGMPYPPARKLLDAGCSLVIATDWNPGSAPNGNLLMQASVLAMAQKLSSAETWAAVTARAAAVLGLSDRGSLEPGKRADMAAFPAADYRAILHAQGSMPPSGVWIAGEPA